MNDEQQKIFVQKLTEETEKQIQDRFKQIFRKNHSQLTDEEISFLQARASYLTRLEVEEYKEELAKNLSGQPVQDTYMEMTRKDLEEVARLKGVQTPEDMKKYPNKDSLVTALKALEA